MEDVLPWVLKLLPSLIALFKSDTPEEWLIAGQKVLREAAQHKVDLDLAKKVYREL
jgi:hypothetical protein